MASRPVGVPEHVHLLFLPAYSPGLQPAEHLWPLTNTILANRHFATIEGLEDAQAEWLLDTDSASVVATCQWAKSHTSTMRPVKSAIPQRN